MIYPAGTLIMNFSGELGMINEVRKRPLFDNDYDYLVEWYGNSRFMTTVCGEAVIGAYVKFLREYCNGRREAHR